MQPAQSSKLLFLGDVFLNKPAIFKLKQHYPFIFNLEAPLAKMAPPKPNKIPLLGDWSYIQRSFPILPIAVCLANNHIMDYGVASFKATLSILKEHGVSFFGAGHKTNNYNNPLTLQISGKTVALMGYCSARPCLYDQEHVKAAPLHMELIKHDITNIRGSVDTLIVNLHWGQPQSPYPLPEQVNMARTLIDRGADAIIGHHTHCIQPIEVYRRRPIAYSLGNLAFPNLIVPSDYINGQPQRIHVDYQIPLNRASLGLLMDLDEMSHEFLYFYFNRSSISPKRVFAHRYATRVKLIDYHYLTAVINRQVTMRRLFRKIANFVWQPSFRKLLKLIP